MNVLKFFPPSSTITHFITAPTNQRTEKQMFPCFSMEKRKGQTPRSAPTLVVNIGDECRFSGKI